MVKKQVDWQIQKNILDLEYRDIKDWMNTFIIISSTLIIGFIIAYLQDSIPEKFSFYSMVFVGGLLTFFFVKIRDLYDEGKVKLQKIKELKVST